MRGLQRISDRDVLREEYRVNESEQKFVDTFFQVTGRHLMRPIEGCDFADPYTKELYEVKNGVLRPSQLLQFRTALYPNARKVHLAVDMGEGEGFLVFEPARTLECHEPDDILHDRLLQSLDCERLLNLKFLLIEEIKSLKSNFDYMHHRVAELQRKALYLRVQHDILNTMSTQSENQDER